MVAADLIDRARAGDGEAFGLLVGPHHRELQVHCYRILGSAQDAEDALQETLLAAWRGLGGFEGRASIRTWLYQVATSNCLKALRSVSRRPRMDWPPPGIDVPEPTRLGEISWLEPYPDVLLEGLADSAPGPEARYEATEAISLAFITALQLLPPRQRAVLILRDVPRSSPDARQQPGVGNQRAQARPRHLAAPAPPPGEQELPPAPNSAPEQELITRLTRAYQNSDLDAVVALLTDDVRLAMPPVPLEYLGREIAARFLEATAFRPGRTFRLVPTRANHQPAYGMYLRDPRASVAHANGLLVLTLAGRQICAMTRFDNSVLARFGLPRILPD